jgi:DNA-directed RNA polymerase subunit alpha
LNPDFIIATLTDKGAELEIEAVVEVGYGFEVSDGEIRNAEPGIIPIPRSFSPVIKVNVSVESTRVAQKTDYEKIVLEVWTNGAITPDEAVKDAVVKLLEGATEINELVNIEE